MNTKNIRQSRSSFFQKCIFVRLAVVAAVMACGMPVAAGGLNWRDLNRFQKTITADSFSQLISDIYVPDGSMIQYLRYEDDSVYVYTDASQSNGPVFKLRFAQVDPAPVIRRVGGDLPLSGLNVALDPGHIGGAWSRMEERFFYVDRQTDWPIQEGAINLYVSRLIRDQLTELGADVHMVKNDLEPSSNVRPDELMKKRTELPPPDPRFKHLPDLLIESSQRDALRKQVEKEFYRKAEINARARRINEEIKPDVTLCVHFNATGYGDEKTLYEQNGLALFVHGKYTAGEVALKEQKLELFRKLLERSHDEELALAENIADAFVDATGLPPAYQFAETDTMKRMGTDYIYARNLAANRKYHGPVVFLEPYFMNNKTVYARIQAGDYDGEKEIDGKLYPSIFREYADAVVDGVMRQYAPKHSTID